MNDSISNQMNNITNESNFSSSYANVLEVNDLVKNFSSKHVLNGVSFNLAQGKVLGILGPNGQGKTTLLNIISGLTKPTSGTVSICGFNVSYETKKLTSFLQEKDYLYKWMKISSAIDFYKTFFDDFDENKAFSLLKTMNLDTNSKVRSLSKGMLEKLGLALTLSRKCKLYILDEPISGVDIISRDKIIHTIINNMDSDSSMIITTHYVGELETLFDEVLFLGDGSIIEKGEAENLRVKYGTSIDEIYRKVFRE